MNVPNYEEKNPYRLKNNIRAWYTDGSSKAVPTPCTSYPEVGKIHQIQHFEFLRL